jgi:hypothetical protein
MMPISNFEAIQRIRAGLHPEVQDEQTDEILIELLEHNMIRAAITPDGKLAFQRIE